MSTDPAQNQAPDPGDKPAATDDNNPPVADLTYVGDEPVVTEGDKGDKSGEGGDDEPITTTAELLAQFEVDPEFFEGLKVPVKVDGKPAEASIKDLVASYQIQEAAQHRLNEAKAKASTINQELAEKSKLLEGHFVTAGKLVELAEAALEQDLKETDWAALKSSDPATFAAQKQLIADRREAIKQIKAQVTEALNAAGTTLTEEQKKQIKEIRDEQETELLKKIPDWNVPEKAKAGKTQLVNYLRNEGFNDEEIGRAIDHRLIVIAHKAMLFDQGQTKTSAAKKQVFKSGKTLRSDGKNETPPKPKSQSDIMYPNG